MRAFSTLEILISLFILTLTLVGVTLLLYGSPYMLANMRLERSAHRILHEELTRVQANSLHVPLSNLRTSTTTRGAIAYSLHGEFLPDDTAIRIYAHATWRDVNGREKATTASTVIFDLFSESREPCDPLVSTNWEEPYIAGRFPLDANELFGKTTSSGPAAISDIQSAGEWLYVAMDKVPYRNAPTLFALTVSDNTLVPIYTHDNSAASQTGYSTLALGNDYLFAGNGFGSASATSCSDGGCAQVHIFSTKHGKLDRVSQLSLSTSSPPYAISMSGISSPATSMHYYRGYLYLGLEKTASGQEFNIIDMHDPVHPRWISGMAIGRSVNTILVRGDYAYIGTDDSNHELVIIDISNPSMPVRAGSWDAPGSVGFGLGTSLVVAGPRAVFGRSYVNNADELVLLSTQDRLRPSALDSDNPGTFLRPESIRDLIGQDFLTFVLTTRSFQVFDITSPSELTKVSDLSFPGGVESASMTCNGSDIYVGSNSESGAEILHIRDL